MQTFLNQINIPKISHLTSYIGTLVQNYADAWKICRCVSSEYFV